jgi:hypothetical protein
MALKHVQEAPAALSARTELPVPPDLEHAIMSCLAEDPADWPATARELAVRRCRQEGSRCIDQGQ